MTRNPKLARKVVYEVFILGLCIYVLVALAAVTFFKLDPQSGRYGGLRPVPD